VNRDEFGQDYDLKETNLSFDTVKQLAAEQEEIHRWKVKWLTDETIEIIEQLKWHEFNNKSLLSFGPKFFLVNL